MGECGKENIIGLRETVPKGCLHGHEGFQGNLNIWGVQGGIWNLDEQGSSWAFVSNGIT